VNRTAGTTADRAPVTRRLSFAKAVFLPALSALSLAASQGAARAGTPATGFAEPYAGVPKYEKYAPTEAIGAPQVNRPLGSKAADRIARALGLNKRQAFTAQQFKLFISGKGVGGETVPREAGRRKRSHPHEHHGQSALREGQWQADCRRAG